MHIDGRSRGSAPNCLLDYFPEDFLLVVDESHVAVPQIGGMYEGDMSRKRNLVDHGFRLPSAMDNRPLRWEEFLDRIGQTIYLSATPGNYEIGKGGGSTTSSSRSSGRPAWSTPRSIVKPTKGQIDDLIDEIQPRAERERAGPGHHADQEDVRGPHRLPPRERHPHPLPPLRGRHPPADRAAARAAAGRVRRAGRHQPAARGSRPARGVAGRDPRRRQGGLPALRQVADPDDRPRRPQRVRPGASCTPTRSPPRWRRRSTRPTGAARSRSPTTRRTASTRSRCARRSPTSPTCSPARTRTPRSCSRPGPAPAEGRAGRQGAGRRCPGWPKARAGSTPPTSPACRARDLADLIQQLTDQMHAAAAELQFEVAARLRDEISDLKKELRQMVEATK